MRLTKWVLSDIVTFVTYILKRLSIIPFVLAYSEKFSFVKVGLVGEEVGIYIRNRVLYIM